MYNQLYFSPFKLHKIGSPFGFAHRVSTFQKSFFFCYCMGDACASVHTYWYVVLKVPSHTLFRVSLALLSTTSKTRVMLVTLLYPSPPCKVWYTLLVQIFSSFQHGRLFFPDIAATSPTSPALLLCQVNLSLLHQDVASISASPWIWEGPVTALIEYGRSNTEEVPA